MHETQLRFVQESNGSQAKRLALLLEHALQSKGDVFDESTAPAWAVAVGEVDSERFDLGSKGGYHKNLPMFVEMILSLGMNFLRIDPIFVTEQVLGDCQHFRRVAGAAVDRDGGMADQAPIVPPCCGSFQLVQRVGEIGNPPHILAEEYLCGLDSHRLTDT